MTVTNRQIQLVSRPEKEPCLTNFALVEVPMPEPDDGEVLLENQYLSLDPYMRARMYAGANYAAPTPLHAPMVGTSVAQVIKSRSEAFAEGDYVVARAGWQEFAVSDTTALRPIDPNIAPVTTALSVLGLPGHTAYGALMRFGQLKPGETLLVSAAAGGVGSVAAQIGRIYGLRVVGIAGGPEKCRYLTETLGLDAAVDRHVGDLPAALSAACPDGIDIYFDNVAGDVAKAVLDLANDYARYLVCGTISINRDLGFAHGTDSLQAILATVLVKRLTLQGFLFSDFADMTQAFQSDVSGWLKSGDMAYKEHVVDGLENAPAAFLSLFTGGNFGKLLVRL
ncbi:MAG: NADP-dependent oxidoreductase [Pseudomonadota bacterium]